MPGHGRFVGPSSVPWSDLKRRPGEQIGDHWQIPNIRGRRAIRHVLYDTNYWKSFVFHRLAAPAGEKGCLSIFGQQPKRHQLLADHLLAERRTPTTGRGRQVDVWELPPHRPDNHWFDCLVGCAVAASMQGVSLIGQGTRVRERRQHQRSEKGITLAQMRERARRL